MSLVDHLLIFGDAESAATIKEFLKELKCCEIAAEYDLITGKANKLLWNGDVIITELISHLALVHLQLKDIRPLVEKFSFLSHLNVSFNRISDISVLEHFSDSLTVLDISHNKISSLDAISDLKCLQILRCNNNEITSLGAICRLVQLKQLWASQNNIDWEEIVHLSALDKLEVVMLTDNPCEEKESFAEFVLALRPSLKFLNGKPIVTTGGRPEDFLKTATGRQMIVQARQQQQNPSQSQSQSHRNSASNATDTRSDLSKSRRTDDTQRSRPSSLGSTTAIRASETSPVDYDTTNSDADPISKAQSFRTGKGTSDRSRRSDISEGSSVTMDDCFQGDISSTKAQQQGRAVAHKRHDNKNKSNHIIPTNEMAKDLLQSSSTPELNASRSNPKSTSKEKRRRNIDDTVSTAQSNCFADKLRDSVQNSTSSEYSNAVANQSIIRFGEADSSPVALCLNEDRSGYARWSKAGPVVCSFEDGRLLCSYRNGSMAAVTDSNGAGSIMDPAGRCLLVLTDRGEASVYDMRGNVIQSLQKPSATAATAMEDGDDTFMELIKQPQQQQQPPADGGKAYKWAFEDVKLEFKPENWEVVVEVKTDRLSCSFSNVTGGQLIKGDHHKKTKKTTTKGGGQGGSGRLPTLSATEHESMRSDMKSLASQLDDMLSSIKKL